MSAAFINVGIRVCVSFSDELDRLLGEPEPDMLKIGQLLTNAYNVLADQLSIELGLDAKAFVFQTVVAQTEASRALDRANKGAPC
jgi:hypothetical protein